MIPKILLVLTLAQALNLTQADEVSLESLNDGPGILPFNLGPTKVISHYHSFVHTINLEYERSKLESIRKQLKDFIPDLNNITSSFFTLHVKYLQNKLDEISNQLETFEVRRVKRGLIDGLGSVIKSISGNLDYTDALKYDNAIAVLKQNQNNIVIELNHQISLSKQWASRNSNVTESIIENQNKVGQMIDSILEDNARKENNFFKYMHLSQLLLIHGDNIDSLSLEFSKLQNILAFIKAKSAHHSVLSYDMFRYMFHRLKSIYNEKEILDISFREYFDIFKLGYYYKDDNIILAIKFPIVSPTNYALYKLSLAPNRDSKILSPTSPYVAIHDKDLLYIETECPKYSHGHLCEDNLSRHHGDQTLCIQHLILQQRIHESCRFSSVILSYEAMEQLDDQHFVLSFPNLTKVRTTCSEDQYRMLQGSYLATIPKGCHLQTPAYTASNYHNQVKGQILKILNIAVGKDNNYNAAVKKTIQLNTIDLNHLHSSNTKISLQEPVTLNTSTMETVYHTTIPVYILLFSAAVLAVIITIIRRRTNQRNDDIKSYSPSETERKATENCSNEVKDSSSKNPMSLSALFSTKVSK